MQGPLSAKAKQDLIWVRSHGKAADAAPYAAALKMGRDESGRIRVAFADGTRSVVSETDLMPRNPAGTQPDTCRLLHLNEACVLENVATRYMASQIYTWTSHVLTAINPYESLPLYSDRLATELPQLAPRDLPPHVFSVAEMAVRHVVRGSQAVIVSGESGAGKTYNMAHVMAYLTRRAHKGGAADGGLGARLGALLLQSNPVLEAFGNAQTVRNHNSSRFGKFVKVVYDPSGTKMVTMTLRTYLLEKVRVVSPAANERTYHVFYALLAGASRQDAARWGLRSQEDHSLTAAASDSDAAADEGSAEKFLGLGEALTCLTVREEEQTDLLGLVSAILHLRDVRFKSLDETGDGGCRAVGSAALAHAVRLLGCPGVAMCLVQRRIRMGRDPEPITVALSPTQASAARDALCKSVYVALFAHICSRFNEAAANIGAQIRASEPREKREAVRPSFKPSTSPASRTAAMHAGPFIGLLDMFGFEVFAVNSFEQLCINLANERLQGYFQHCVFTAEEEVHRLEGVPWPDDVEYHDNSGCISLITDMIFVMLDEACNLQTGTEPSFFLRVAETCSRDPFFASARRKRLREDEGFVVRHFAGDVCYCSATAGGSSGVYRDGADQALDQPVADTWLVKNADRLLPELAAELRGSSLPLVATLFANEQGERVQAKASVVRRFCADLDSLLRDLSQTHSRFLRCVKPNSEAAPKVFDRTAVLLQLRCLGMTEVVRLMHRAFPTRIPYTELHDRYAQGMPPVLAKLPPRDFCETIALLCDVSPHDMHLGTTRLFLRGGKGEFLEDLGTMDLTEAMPLLLRKIEAMGRRRAAAKTIACAMRAHHLSRRYRRRREASHLIVRVWRGALARTEMRAKRSEAQKKTAKLLHMGAAAARAAQVDFEAQLATVGGTSSIDTAPAGLAGARESRPPPTAVDKALHSSLGVKPLCAAQFRAVRALRQRLGEHLAESSSNASASTKATMRAPGADASQPQLDLPVPERRRLNQAGQADDAIATDKAPLTSGRPTKTDHGDDGETVDVALARDARDGTLGIDLDQFSGKPTVAVVVPGGPAARDGTARPGDVILAVDGIACASIGEVIAVLSSPATSVKNPLSVQLLRKAKFAVIDSMLLVRALSSSAAADGLAGMSSGATKESSSRTYGTSKSGGLQQLTDWTTCRCQLMSDRRLLVSEPSLGIEAAFDLRATDSVQLILTPAGRAGTSETARSCLQVRTTDGLIEFGAPNPVGGEPSVLLRWQRPLEEMLMISLSSALQGWMHVLVPPSNSSSAMSVGDRILLDLNSHSQLRTLVDRDSAERRALVGMVELVELQKIELVDLRDPPVGNASLSHATNALSLSTSDITCTLAFSDMRLAALWANELESARKVALVSLVQYTGMILIDGWLEYQGDEDEWASGFFMLTIGAGLQCFEDTVGEPTMEGAIETLPLEQITGAVRSKGIDYYDWCIDVRTTDGDYIRVRPPRQAEMTRWLATINLYCTPPPKKKPERPKRRSVRELTAASESRAVPALQGERTGGQKLKKRAESFNRGRRVKADDKVPTFAQEVTMADVPMPKMQRANSFSRRLARRAASFSRNK